MCRRNCLAGFIPIAPTPTCTGHRLVQQPWVLVIKFQSPAQSYNADGKLSEGSLTPSFVW